MEDKISNRLCGSRKGHSTQHMLMFLLEKWRKCLDRGGVVGTILLDLSKAFDCMPHDLFIAKLEAYGFSESAMKLLKSYLTNRYQRVKIGSTFGSWKKLFLGVPQGSVLGPLFFNIDINDLFFQLDDLNNFADDNTIDAAKNSIEEVIYKLEDDLMIVLEWLKINGFVANPKKF